MLPFGNRRIQKATPKPFSRPGIELADPAVRRDWVDICAEDVVLGDTIPDLGVVIAIGHTVSSTGTLVRLLGPNKELVLAEDAIVKAFHRVV